MIRKHMSSITKMKKIKDTFKNTIRKKIQAESYFCIFIKNIFKFFEFDSVFKRQFKKMKTVIFRFFSCCLILQMKKNQKF